MIPEAAAQLPKSWAEWHKAQLEQTKPLTYEESQAAVAIWKSGAHMKEDAK